METLGIYIYNTEEESYACPMGGLLWHTTADKEDKRTYRTTPKHCVGCPHKAKCGANENGQKILQRHIWQDALDTIENIRKAEFAKKIYAMRYTQYSGLSRVTAWVRLKFATMNLKKLATWDGNSSYFSCVFFAFQIKLY